MAAKMETLRVQISPQKAELVRKMAMDKFGYGKGAISKAVNVALDEWVMKRKQTDSKKVNWEKLRGALKHVKMTSVELQHAAWDTD